MRYGSRYPSTSPAVGSHEPARCAVARHRAPAPSIANRRPASNCAYRLRHQRASHAWIRSSCASNSSVSGCSWRTRSTSVRVVASGSLASAVARDCHLFARSVGLGRQLSGLRHRHPARRSARTGRRWHHRDPLARRRGDGHDALFAQGLDNPCGGSPHDHTRHYDDGPSGPETRVL